MKRTVYCTFDHRDLADLAMGKLRASVKPIEAISYVDDQRYHNHTAGDGVFVAGIPVNGMPSAGMPAGDLPMGGFISSISTFNNPDPTKPPRPATVKITCDESVQQQVVSKLINLHGYRIVAT